MWIIYPVLYYFSRLIKVKDAAKLKEQADI